MDAAGEARAVNTRPVWWTALAVFVFATILFPIRTELLNRGLEGVFIAPDGQARYDARSLAETFSVLSGPQRARRFAYAWSELTLDVVFPLVYVPFFALLLLAVYPGAPATPGRHAFWRVLAVGAPFGAGLADWAENWQLARIARADAWERLGGDLDGVAAAIAAMARWAALATGVKRGCLLGVAALLVVALLRSGRLGKVVTLLWLGRVSILALLGLLAFASLGGADKLSPTIPNMLALDRWWQLFAVGYLASAVALLAGFALLLTWELAPLRVRAALPDLPRFVATRAAADPWRNSVFLFFALPLVARAVLRSGRDAGSFLAGGLAALFGIAVAVTVLWLVKALRAILTNLPAGWVQVQLAKLVHRLGPGYENPATGGFLDGHGLAAAFAGVVTAIYALGWWALDPGRAPAWCAAVPTAGYVLGLIAVLSSILAGATFFFDRWRVPLVAVVLLWVSVVNLMRPMEHEFEWRWNGQPPPAANRAADARLAQGPPRILTVVTASGGGIQAAAWTARVLTGLQEELGPEFTRSIALVSAVSGGSVGSYFALSAFAEQGGERGAMRADALRAVSAAASESSLEPTAWGLLYPDLQRGLEPFVSSTRDRGWALERGWLAALRKHGLDPAHGRQEFSDWVRGAESGALPAVIFNATRMDDGMPLRLSTVARRDVSGHSAVDGDGDAPLLGLVPELTYQYEEPTPGHLAIPAVTAARLSASFPYVSPIARPESKRRDPKQLRLWHAADGGYFDNHGTVAALAWLYELQRAWGEDFATHVDHLIWIQIDAFPESDITNPDHAPGWTLSALGPLKGLLRVRTASQRVRRATEVAIERQLQGTRFTVVTLRPPPRKGPHRGAPLSWALGRGDVERMEREWREVAPVHVGELRILLESAP
jgi:hypothetical protein